MEGFGRNYKEKVKSSRMLIDIEVSLQKINYPEILNLHNVIAQGVSNEEFVNLITYLVEDIAFLSKVSLPQGLSKMPLQPKLSWLSWLSSSLWLLECPEDLTHLGAPEKEKTGTPRSRLLMLSFLLEKQMQANVSNLPKKINHNDPNVRSGSYLLNGGVTSASFNSDGHIFLELSSMRWYSLDSQISRMVKSIQVTEQRFQNLQTVISQLEKTLRKWFPNCKLVDFGSTASGFGMNNSDLDIFMYINGCVHSEFLHYGNKEKSEFIASFLRTEEKYSNVSAISNAKIPIIKIQDRKTGIKCDINFTADMGVKNSKFLSYLASLDRRCVPFVLTVKYFCLKKGIIGSGLGQHLNSYTVVLMAVFFLQQKGILPSISKLQEGVNGDFCYCWNFAFNDEYVHLEKQTQQTVASLLADFFRFYSQFDYNFFIICPLMGYSIQKHQLKSGVDLPTRMMKETKQGRILTYERMHLDCPFVVQDPFELQRNVSAAVNRDFVLKMKKDFQSTYDKLRKNASLVNIMF